MRPSRHRAIRKEWAQRGLTAQQWAERCLQHAQAVEQERARQYPKGCACRVCNVCLAARGYL